MAHKSLEQHKQKHKHRLSAYPAALPPPEILHHRSKGSQVIAHQDWYIVLQDFNHTPLVGLGTHGNNQVRPCTSHAFSTASKGATAMQKPGNNAKAFGSSRQVVHKNTVENNTKNTNKDCLLT
jgi:hypothetical protein